MTLDHHLRERLTTYITKTSDLDHAGASHSIDAAVAFLQQCAATSGEHTPTPAADIGWHAFILHTREYADYCQNLGVFVHHTPSGADCAGTPCTNGDCTSGGPPRGEAK